MAAGVRVVSPLWPRECLWLVLGNLHYAVLTMSAALACIAFAAHINTDYDHSADFGHYKTYSWMKVQLGDSLWQDRIVSDKRAPKSCRSAAMWSEPKRSCSR